MGKKKRAKRGHAKRHVAKHGPVWHLSAEEATMLRKPRYDGYACGTGPHGDAKYNRTREKRAWKRDLRNERGGLSPFANGQLRGSSNLLIRCRPQEGFAA